MSAHATKEGDWCWDSSFQGKIWPIWQARWPSLCICSEAQWWRNLFCCHRLKENIWDLVPSCYPHPGHSRDRSLLSSLSCMFILCCKLTYSKWLSENTFIHCVIASCVIMFFWETQCSCHHPFFCNSWILCILTHSCQHKLCRWLIVFRIRYHRLAINSTAATRKHREKI